MYFDSIFFSRTFSPFRLSIDLLVFLIFVLGFSGNIPISCSARLLASLYLILVMAVVCLFASTL